MFAVAVLVAEGEDRGLDAVLQAEFGEDAADMGLDGLLTDLQVAPGARPHLPVDRTAPLTEFARIAADYPVFRIEQNP